MNHWVKKSITLAKMHGYLDRLHEVYPMASNKERPLPSDVVLKVRSLLKSKKYPELIEILLKLKKFPLKDSYVAFLRLNRGAIRLNPKTVKRLGKMLYALGSARVTELVQTPKETNRQIGPMFRNWLNSQGYPLLGDKKFLAAKGVALLEGSDSHLAAFANKNLGTKLKKGLDLVIKVRGKYLIGEAKFLTARGGHQTAQFNDARTVLRARTPANVRSIAILDGVVWVESGDKMHKGICREKNDAFSALLLKDYIRRLQKAR